MAKGELLRFDTDEDAWKYLSDLGDEISKLKTSLNNLKPIFNDIDTRLNRLEAER